MMHRNKLVAICSIIAVIGILLLYVHARSLGSREVSIGEISYSDVGSIVSTEGVVVSIIYYEGGSALMEMYDGDDSISVYFPPDISQHVKARVLSGMTMKVRGEVEVYNGDLEIVVRSEKDFRILDGFTMKTIFDKKEIFDGKSVCVMGTVFYKETLGKKTRFKLVDNKNTEYEILCSIKNDGKNFHNGSSIEVRGVIMFEDDVAYLDCREVIWLERR